MKKHNLLKGSLFMFIAFFFVALFGLFLKLSSVRSSSLWSAFFAYVFALFLHSLFILPKGIALLKTKRILGHFARGFFGVLATILYILAIDAIPLMNATLLFNTTPLFVPILAYFFLKARPTLKIWLSILLGFIGILFIIRPTAGILDHPGTLIGLGSGLALATAFIYVKLLTTTEPRERILFYFFFFGTILTLPLFPYFGEIHSYSAILYGALAAVFFLLAQIFIVKSYENAEAHEVGAFQYTAVLFAGFFDWIFWKKTPDIYDAIGAILVILGGSLVIAMTRKK